VVSEGKRRALDWASGLRSQPLPLHPCFFHARHKVHRLPVVKRVALVESLFTAGPQLRFLGINTAASLPPQSHADLVAMPALEEDAIASMSFSFARKFSINRNTGVPRPCRRFSVGEPSLSEASSKIHRQFRAAHEGHLPHAGLDATRASTGVVWCTERAGEHGFFDEPDKWANLGRKCCFLVLIRQCC
jgi:hypothetical protein